MDADAVVVGSGPNGLVAANVLADAGWDVLVLESQPGYGGAVASARDVHPDFVHDTFSSFHPLALASPAMRALRLEEHGLRWAHAPSVVGHTVPRRHVGRAAPRPDAYGGRAGRARTGRRGRLAAAVRGLGPGRRGGRRRAADAVPAAPARCAGGGAAARDGGAAAAARGPRLGTRVRRTRVPRAARADAAGRQRRARRRRPRLAGVRGLRAAARHDRPAARVPGAGRRSRRAGDRPRPPARPPVAGGSSAGPGSTGCWSATAAPTPCVRRPGRSSRPDGRCSRTCRRRRSTAGWCRGRSCRARTRLLMRRFRWDPGTIKVDWALSGPVPWASAPSAAPGTLHLSRVTRGGRGLPA